MVASEDSQHLGTAPPLRTDAASADRGPNACRTAPQSAERDCRLHRGHILIVEDDLIVADLIDQILRFEKFRASHVIDGRSAVSYAAEHVPDLILMDLMLPIMSGKDASREIKAHDDAAVRRIPIVAMSAGVNLRASSHDLDVDGILSKPFDIDELLAMVEIHIRRDGV